MSDDSAAAGWARASSKLVLALPKGRVLEVAIEKLRVAGLAIDLSSDERALRHESADATVMLMRNADVPTYVELGVADLGVVGRDVLLEAGSRLYAPVDLGFGICRISLIRPHGERQPIRRVASKYPNITAGYLATVGSSAEVVTLAGKQTRWAGHDGQSLGGMVASLMSFPEQGLVVAVIANTSYADTETLRLKINKNFTH